MLPAERREFPSPPMKSMRGSQANVSCDHAMLCRFPTPSRARIRRGHPGSSPIGMVILGHRWYPGSRRENLQLLTYMVAEPRF